MIATNPGDGEIRFHEAGSLVFKNALQPSGATHWWVKSRGDAIGWKVNSEQKLTRAFSTQTLTMIPIESEDGFEGAPPLAMASLRMNTPRPGSITFQTSQGASYRISHPEDRRISAWAVFLDGRIALGTSNRLSIVDLTRGRRLTCFGHVGGITQTAVHRSGEILVSAGRDQTVRLWNASSCELLLTFFNDEEDEWVAWTPEGYYIHSKNGAKLLGFRINRGARQSPIVESAEEMTTFHRPDRIRSILEAVTAFPDQEVPADTKGTR